MRGLSRERKAALAGLAFVVLYVAALALGVEAGATDAEILEHYGDDGARTREVVAFFLIAAAALAFVVFAAALRELVRSAGQAAELLASIGFAGGIVLCSPPAGGQLRLPRDRLRLGVGRVLARPGSSTG